MSFFYARSYQELHAFRLQLQSLIDRKMWKSLAYYFQLFDEWSRGEFDIYNDADKGKVYEKAAKMLKRSKVWKEAKRLVKTKHARS